VNRGVTKLWELGKSTANDLLARIGMTWREVLDDFKALSGSQKDKLEELLQAWAEDETAYELLAGFLKASEKGWDAAVAFLKRRNRGMQEYLAQQVRLTPHLVGGIDGFLRIYLATPADRWGRSPRYRQGVKIGRVVGIICAFTIFLPLSVGRAIISALPGASRIAKYLHSRWHMAGQTGEADNGAET
jgi:hypothetical protein